MSHTTRSSRLPEQPRPDQDAGPGPESGGAGGTPAGAAPDTPADTDTPPTDPDVPDVDASEDAAADSVSDGPARPGDDEDRAPDQEGAPGQDADAVESPDATPRPDHGGDTETDTEPKNREPSATPETEAAAPEEAVTPEGAVTPEEAVAPEEAGAVAGPPAPPAPPARSGRGGWRVSHPRVARGVTVGTTVLAGVLVLFALVVPNRLDRLSVAAFLRIPAEGVLLAALLLALPPRPRRIVSYVVGALLGLLTVLKLVDMGFYSVLVRPFDLVLDWSLFGNAADWVRESFGRTGEVVALIAVVALVVALLVLMTLAVARLTDVMVRNRPVAGRTVLVLGTAWITCVTLGVQFTGVPVASQIDARIVQNRARQVQAGLHDGEVFERQASVDAFADTPPDQLLTGLRGKDVLFTFIESYGRTAIDDPAMSRQIDTALTQGNDRLKSAGFSSRSGWLRSPVTGAGSWLAHSTFLSGLWIKNQQRYRSLTTSDRSTLTSYFRKTGAWRTVGIVPGVRRAWPEGRFFGLDHIYDSEHLGYKGPYFSWTPVPDQFSLEAFERLEHGKKDRGPMMAEIILASSHNPWAPVAHMIDWNDLGDGSVFEKIKKEGKDPKEVWKNPESVRTEYRRAIEYSLHSLTEYVEKYGDKNTVLVFLGDHQPVPTVTAGSTSRDVPVTIVAHDPKVLDRVSDWGWTDGLKPADNAPEWRMDTFRDRFLTAFGPHPEGSAATASKP
ncbi:sulfatase [Streptomyces sp. NPDC005381]|uniref:sulfatase n=1 Tax=Streptomyces sp. NPDC005381 TaxID=3364714 RepID=UPI00369685B2